MNNKIRICLIDNYGSHYRKNIYSLMDKNFDCYFFFGVELSNSNIKKLDYNILRNVKEVHNRNLGRQAYWQDDTVKLMCKHFDYYIIIGEPACISSWVILICAKIMNKKVICWTHGWYGHEGIMKLLIKKMFYKMFYRIMTYGERAIELMKEKGFDERKLFQIANSLDYDKQLSIRKTLSRTKLYQDHFSNNNPNIIYVGRIQKIKKLDLLIQAIKQMNDENRPCNCIIVGPVSDDKSIPNLIKAIGIEGQVWIYGPSYDEKIIGQMFYDADLCVSPGNIGLTAIHSLTYGCPAITNNDFNNQMPEFEAIKAGKTGDFFKKDDLSSLKEKLIEWTSKDKLKERSSIRKEAQETIDSKWNPYYQIDVLKSVLSKNRIN